MNNSPEQNEQPNFWMSPDGITTYSKRGFSVRAIDNQHIRYERHPRSLTIPAESYFLGEDDEENDADVIIIQLEQGCFCWDPPHENDPLTEQDKEMLRRDLSDAFAFQGTVVQFDPELKKRPL